MGLCSLCVAQRQIPCLLVDGTVCVQRWPHVCCVAVGCRDATLFNRLGAKLSVVPAEDVALKKPCKAFTCLSSEQSREASQNVFQNKSLGQWASSEGLCSPTEMKGSRVVHTAFNRSSTSRLTRFDHLPGCVKGVFKQFYYPCSSTSCRILARSDRMGTCQWTIYWCLGRGLLLRDWFPESSNRTESLQGHLFSGQSLGPLPCPLPLSVTHLWPAVPLPASLGMKPQMELPSDSNEHVGDVVWLSGGFFSSISVVKVLSLLLTKKIELFFLFSIFISPSQIVHNHPCRLFTGVVKAHFWLCFQELVFVLILTPTVWFWQQLFALSCLRRLCVASHHPSEMKMGSAAGSLGPLSPLLIYSFYIQQNQHCATSGQFLGLSSF